MKTRFGTLVVAMIALFCGAVAGLGGASAEELVTRSKAGAFDDVKFDLGNAIIERGLVVDYAGNVAGMLDRTGADVGSTTKLYKHAEYMLFCSAKLSRAMMEADPTNIGFCPFVIFLYERADKPGEIVVGYRPPVARGTDASKAALAEIDALLKGIVSDAVK